MALHSFSLGSLYRGNTQVLGTYPLTNNLGTKKTANTTGSCCHAGTCLNSTLPVLIGSDYGPSANMDIGSRFGQRLRGLRHTHGMTQIDLAVMLGMDRSYISEVERGKKGISLVSLEIIALGFHVPLSDLFRDI